MLEENVGGIKNVVVLLHYQKLPIAVPFAFFVTRKIDNCEILTLHTI
jgi:hypothetical protein